MKTDKITEKFSAHYISGTHWDREWYRPFQEFRLLLVELIDDLLDLMEGTNGFDYFHLDGQTCVLEDYLEIRPENRTRLRKLIQVGRILIGPWFTMPDLFCPDEESLVRNFLVGRRISHEWGVEPMSVAYTCDMFGHPSQMPQIYAGFDLKYCVLGRGTNEHTTPAFFNWQAPDGSTVFVFKLQDHLGYGAFMPARGFLETDIYSDRAETLRLAKKSLKEYIEHEVARTSGMTLCLIDSLDHKKPARDVPAFIKMIQDIMPTVNAKHSTLPEFFMDAEANAGNIPTRKGELREPSKNRNPYLWLIPNCVSSRIRLKTANDECQNLLESWVEPWMALANDDGANLSENYLRIVWKNLLLNHAHDSICGCSIDRVHQDMMFRYDQCLVLGRQLRNKAFGYLTTNCKELGQEDHEFTVIIANPVPWKRKEVLQFNVDLPLDFPTVFTEGFAGSQDIKSFTLHTLDGSEIPYQRLSINPRFKERTAFAQVDNQVGDGEFARYKIAAEIELPALGFTSILVKPCPTPYRRMGSLRTGPSSAENEYLAIAIESNGTLTLIDKSYREIYRDLLILENRSEIGSGWFHAPTVTDELVLSTASNVQVSVIHDGPEMVTFKVAIQMNVPFQYDWLHEKRSDARIALPITNYITLRKRSKTVDIETVIDNQAEDHCLRLLLPTDIADASSYLAHQPYDFVERDTKLNPETARWQEVDLTEKPFLHLQAIGCGARGLAFLGSGGLHEGGVRDDRRRTMQVTLLRSFRRTFNTAGETDGLEKGEIRHHYALMPFPGELDKGLAIQTVTERQSGILTRQSGKISSGYPKLSGDRKPQQSFIEQQDNKLIVSAVKTAENGDGLIMRLWNPADQPRTETVKFYKFLQYAEYCKLSEDKLPGERPEIKDNCLVIEAGPRKIVTVRVRF
jgi:alpha-mannosidase/mannosylglycerate hydrolase